MKKYTPVILALLLLFPMIFAPSCANTKQAPSGGKKDTIPPYITMINPLPGVTGFPLTGGKIVFDFNEYVTIKNSQNVFLSPPLKRTPKSVIKGHSLIVSFEDTLLANTTYTLNLTDAIADNNEGNMFPGFTFAFSTGDNIDSMYITGTIQDCSTLEPLKGATVLLYDDLSDSAVFLRRPYAAVKTDEWGFFTLPYIKDTVYRLFAIEDNSNNNIYDPEEDRIGFVDSLIRPVNKVADSIPELMKYDMKDTLNCLKRVSEYDINVFREKPSKQYIKNFGRSSERCGFITFNAENAWIDSLWIKGYKSGAAITQFNIQQDSLVIWLNDRRPGPDTLNLVVNYRKTDSAGTIVPFMEELRLYEEGLGKKAYTRHKKPSEIKHEDTICKLSFTAKPETVERNGFELAFTEPVIRASFDSLKAWSVNPRQQETELTYTVEFDSTDVRKFRIHPDTDYQQGWEYIVKIPYRCFRGLNGYYSDSTEVKVSLPSDEKLSSIGLTVSGVESLYIVDLMDEAGKSVLNTHMIDSDTTVAFPYLKAAKYRIRFTKDANGNSIVDTGNILEHRQCEPVCFMKFGEEKFIDVPESSEITQSVNLSELF